MPQNVEYIIYGVPATTDLISIMPSLLSAVAATISALIALWALRFSAKQLTILETHNRLMVKPVLDIKNHVNETKGIYSLIIYNKGTGPAFIESVTLSIDNKEVTATSPLETLLKEFIPNISSFDYGHETITDSTLLPGEKIKPLTINYGEYGSPTELYKAFQERTKLSIKYKSIYGEDFIYETTPDT